MISPVVSHSNNNTVATGDARPAILANNPGFRRIEPTIRQLPTPVTPRAPLTAFGPERAKRATERTTPPEPPSILPCQRHTLAICR